MQKWKDNFYFLLVVFMSVLYKQTRDQKNVWVSWLYLILNLPDTKKFLFLFNFMLILVNFPFCKTEVSISYNNDHQ